MFISCYKKNHIFLIFSKENFLKNQPEIYAKKALFLIFQKRTKTNFQRKNLRTSLVKNIFFKNSFFLGLKKKESVCPRAGFFPR